jgi:tetratricopeptide (TPR) repeat protein
LNANAELIGSANGLHEPFLRRAADAEAETSSSHALGAFLTMRLVDQFAADRQPPHSAALTYQIRATRDFLTGLHPPTIEGNHLLQIVRVAEGIGGSGKVRMLWPPLLAFGYWLENELRLDEAMDVLESGRRLSGEDVGEEDVAALLQLGRVLRRAGRYEESREAYENGGALAARRGDTHSEMRSRVGRARVAQELGNLAECERILEGVLTDARRSGDTYAEAVATHDLGQTHYFMGRHASAIQLTFGAFNLYEQRSDRTRALSDTGLVLKELGHYSAAKRALLLTLEYDPPPENRTRALVELMDLGALMQDRLLFERGRREISQSLDVLPPDERVEFEMKLGRGLWAFDRPAEGEARLEQAVALAERYGLGERLFRAEVMLREIRESRQAALPPTALPPEEQPAPELRATIDSLNALAGSR